VFSLSLGVVLSTIAALEMRARSEGSRVGEPQGRAMNALAAVHGPLSIGEIADRSVTLAVRHWRTLLVLTLIDAIPVGLIRVATPDDTGIASLRWLVAYTLLATFVIAASVVTVVAAARPSPMAAIASAVQLFPRALMATLLTTGWMIAILIVIGLCALVAGAVFLGAGENSAQIAVAVAASLVGLAIVPAGNLVLGLVIPVLVLERLGPWRAFVRSIRLVRSAGFVRAWLLGLAALAVIFGPALVLSTAADYVVSTFHVPAFRLVQQFLADSVSLALGTTFLTVTAIELRARSEGTDLAAELGEREAAAGPQ
jgi:hypothetical protein